MVDARTRTGTHALTLPLNEKLDEHCEQKKEKRLDGEKKQRENEGWKNAKVVFIFKAKWHKHKLKHTHTRARNALYLVTRRKDKSVLKYEQQQKKNSKIHKHITNQIKKKLSEMFDGALLCGTNVAAAAADFFCSSPYFASFAHSNTHFLLFRWRKAKKLLYFFVKL